MKYLATKFTVKTVVCRRIRRIVVSRLSWERPRFCSSEFWTLPSATFEGSLLWGKSWSVIESEASDGSSHPAIGHA